MNSANGGLTGFVQKLDNSGNFLWAKKISNSRTRSFSIQSDSLGDIYCTGTYSGASYFNPNSPNDSLVSFGFADIYILKLDSFGSFIRVNSLNGEGNGISYSLKLNSEGEIIIGGLFSGDLSFNGNPTPPTLTSSNSTIFDGSKADMFIFKLSSIIGIGVSVTKNETNNDILNLYPNPTSNNLSISNNKLVPNRIEILTITGKLVTPLNPKEYSFDISNLEPGIYLLQLSYDNQVITEKFIKH